MDIKNIANRTLQFTIHRVIEILGAAISVVGILLLIALISYSPKDPNFIFPENTQIQNLLGFQGSYISDLFFQSIGIISYLIPLTLIFTGINILKKKDIFLVIENVFFIILYSFFGSLFFNIFYQTTFDLYINGNGGFVGQYISESFFGDIMLLQKSLSYYFSIILILVLFLISINFSPKKFWIFIKELLNEIFFIK